MATRVVRQLRLEFSLFAVELCSEAFERDRTETETTEREREREKRGERIWVLAAYLSARVMAMKFPEF